MNNEKSNQEENKIIIDSYDYLANAASTQDCTGLIPSKPTSEAELQSYEDLYKFQPPTVKMKKDENTEPSA